MSIYKCPKGHESTESDYCSECGTKIEGTPKPVFSMNAAVLTAPQTTANAVETCPDCTAPHDLNSGNFCEICGYNFSTGAHGEVPPVVAMPINTVANTLTAAVLEKPLTPPPLSSSLEIVVTIDPSLGEAGSPEAPTHLEPITFHLDKESHLIGRRNQGRGIYPEVALDFDDAVSHRHALLIQQPDGTFVLRDIGSTNGTKLNGVELTAMVDVPIKEGDEFTLGHWTRITVKAIH